MKKDKLGLREKLFRVGVTLAIVVIMSAAMWRAYQDPGDKSDP
jgi:hypothetical protein